MQKQTAESRPQKIYNERYFQPPDVMAGLVQLEEIDLDQRTKSSEDGRKDTR